jgi:hypothetical protein
MADQKAGDRAVKLAVGILLLWVGGALLFVAFMSGKVDSLTIGKDASGKAQGPRDASELIGRLATNVQAAEGTTTSQEGGSAV